MKLELDNGTLFVNQRVFCHTTIGNEKSELRPGVYGVVIGTAFHLDDGPVLPEAVGLGWIGNLPGCDVILGHIRSHGNLIASQSDVSNLIHHIERAENTGETVTLEVAE